jgi:hypothetical protein
VAGEFASILGKPMTAGLAAALVLVNRKPATVQIAMIFARLRTSRKRLALHKT